MFPTPTMEGDTFRSTKRMLATEWLKQGFEYDRWATGLWLEAYPDMPEPKQAEEVIEHIISAVEIWLTRFPIENQQPEGGFEERLIHATETWLNVLETIPLDQVIAYTNKKGQPTERQIGSLAAHTINHGTYHRGQLRGIADEQGFLDFPETDLFVFYTLNHLYGA